MYRDNVRVQPYGAPNDDWLQIDRMRAKDKAGNMFGNDQIVGQIKITKDGNKNLKDKTSREGIIEDTIAFEQLSRIVKAILSYIRIKIYQRYKTNEQVKREIKLNKQNKQQVENISKIVAKTTRMYSIRLISLRRLLKDKRRRINKD